MTIRSLAPAIARFSVDIGVTRFLPPTIIQGRVQGKPVEERFTICASIQPMSAKDLKLLPEGMRTEGIKKVYTASELFTLERSACDMPDRLHYRNEDYQVSAVEDWLDLGGFFKIIATRLQ